MGPKRGIVYSVWNSILNNTVLMQHRSFQKEISPTYADKREPQPTTAQVATITDNHSWQQVALTKQYFH